MTDRTVLRRTRLVARVAPTPAVAMRRRTIRLAVVSAVALGVIWWLAAKRTGAPAVATSALLIGWHLMPTLLAASLVRREAVRLLVVPSTLVSLPVAAIAAGPWVPAGLPRFAWLAVAVGIVLGGVLGLWLWLGAFPRPGPLRDPRSPLRWALIAVHVAPIVVGIALLIAG